MTDHRIVVTLSEQAFEVAQQMARAAAQPVEQIIQQRLEKSLAAPLSSSSEQAELAALSALSDEALWTIAREQTPSDLRERGAVLLALNKLLALTPDEETELDQILEASDRVMLRKAVAASLLTQRGYKVTPEDMVRRA